MINILIPACGKTKFYEESYYPQNVVEINGKPMIQYVIDNYKDLKDAKFTFCLFREECDMFHTDKIVALLTDNHSNIVRQENPTEGALCTAMLAIDYINNEDELIIANSDQVIEADIQDAVNYFRRKKLDSAVISFDSVHPRWSYIRIQGEDVIETAEKHPLSKHAIAGFYYFAHGKDFIEAAKKVIKKKEQYNEKYFISSSINELILDNKKIGYFDIAHDKYHSFYSPDKINEFVKGKK